MSLIVVGNVTEDIIFRLPRLPQLGETVIASERLSDIGGKGLNQAIIAARAGMQVRLVAPVGDDAAGRRARALIRDEPLEAQLIAKDGPTDQSIIAVAEGGENTIISSAFAASSLTIADVIGALGGMAAKDWLLMQGNLSQEITLGLLRLARAAGLRTIVNASPIRWDYSVLLPWIDLLILNEPELGALSQRCGLASGIATLIDSGVGQIIVTLGARGSVFAEGDQRLDAPAQSATVVDTAGAGDTFCGTYLAALARGKTPKASLHAAAAAAAITIGRSGTWSAFPSQEQLSAILSDDEESDAG